MFNIFNKKNKKEKKDSGIQKNGYEKEIENNVNIYVMPEKFRVVRKQKNGAKATGILIMAIGAAILAGASALAYFYLTKAEPSEKPSFSAGDVRTEKTKKTPRTMKQKKTAEKEKPAVVPVKVDSPKDDYLKAKAELDKVNNFNDFERLILKYGSQKRIKELEKEKKEVENAPDSFKNNIVSLVIRQSMPKLNEISGIKTEIKGNVAVLSAVAVNSGKQGTIIMEREDGVWKLSSESWEDAKGQERGNENDEIKEKSALKSGTDSDKDGLTDKEEAALGSDPSSPDSDGDGYLDLDEVLSLYNPAGKGKIENSFAVQRYENETYGYALLYPSDWTINKMKSDDSVIFKSSDNYFIQVIVQKNIDNQFIDEWYGQQFNAENIDDSRRVFGNKWSGIRNDDGLTVYLTDDDYNYIYTIAYSLGDREISEYGNIFEMMIKSFTLK